MCNNARCGCNRGGDGYLRQDSRGENGGDAKEEYGRGEYAGKEYAGKESFAGGDYGDGYAGGKSECDREDKCNRDERCEFKKEPLKGAKFELLDCKGRPVACGATDCRGEVNFEELKCGTYFIRQIGAPECFFKSDDVREIRVESCKTHCVEFVNAGKPGRIKLSLFGSRCCVK